MCVRKTSHHPDSQHEIPKKKISTHIPDDIFSKFKMRFHGLTQISVKTIIIEIARVNWTRSICRKINVDQIEQLETARVAA